MTTTYTTSTKVQRRLSADGVTLRTDDDATNALNECMEMASIDIDAYVGNQYTSAVIATSDLFIKLATDISVFYLCHRRANSIPDSVLATYERAMELLERIRTGVFVVPNLARRVTSGPVLSNIRPRRRPFPRPVVVPGTSTGDSSGYVRHLDRLDWQDYTI